jgi:hypothetical protein
MEYHDHDDLCSDKLFLENHPGISSLPVFPVYIELNEDKIPELPELPVAVGDEWEIQAYPPPPNPGNTTDTPAHSTNYRPGYGGAPQGDVNNQTRPSLPAQPQHQYRGVQHNQPQQQNIRHFLGTNQSPKRGNFQLDLPREEQPNPTREHSYVYNVANNEGGIQASPPSPNPKNTTDTLNRSTNYRPGHGGAPQGGVNDQTRLSLPVQPQHQDRGHQHNQPQQQNSHHFLQGEQPHLTQGAQSFFHNFSNNGNDTRGFENTARNKPSPLTHTTRKKRSPYNTSTRTTTGKNSSNTAFSVLKGTSGEGANNLAVVYIPRKNQCFARSGMLNASTTVMPGKTFYTRLKEDGSACCRMLALEADATTRSLKVEFRDPPANSKMASNLQSRGILVSVYVQSINPRDTLVSKIGNVRTVERNTKFTRNILSTRLALNSSMPNIVILNVDSASNDPSGVVVYVEETYSEYAMTIDKVSAARLKNGITEGSIRTVLENGIVDVRCSVKSDHSRDYTSILNARLRLNNAPAKGGCILSMNRTDGDSEEFDAEVTQCLVVDGKKSPRPESVKAVQVDQRLRKTPFYCALDSIVRAGYPDPPTRPANPVVSGLVYNGSIASSSSQARHNPSDALSSTVRSPSVQEFLLRAAEHTSPWGGFNPDPPTGVTGDDIKNALNTLYLANQKDPTALSLALHDFSSFTMKKVQHNSPLHSMLCNRDRPPTSDVWSTRSNSLNEFGGNFNVGITSELEHPQEEIQSTTVVPSETHQTPANKPPYQQQTSGGFEQKTPPVNLCRICLQPNSGTPLEIKHSCDFVLIEALARAMPRIECDYIFKQMKFAFLSYAPDVAYINKIIQETRGNLTVLEFRTLPSGTTLSREETVARMRAMIVVLAIKVGFGIEPEEETGPEVRYVKSLWMCVLALSYHYDRVMYFVEGAAREVTLAKLQKGGGSDKV